MRREVGTVARSKAEAVVERMLTETRSRYQMSLAQRSDCRAVSRKRWHTVVALGLIARRIVRSGHHVALQVGASDDTRHGRKERNGRPRAPSATHGEARLRKRQVSDETGIIVAA